MYLHDIAIKIDKMCHLFRRIFVKMIEIVI